MLKKNLVILIILISVCAVFFIAAYQNHYFSKRAKECAYSQAKETAYRYGNAVGNQLNVACVTARTLAQLFETYKDPDSGIVLSRENVIELLRSTLEKNPDYLGVWVLWEPNAFDGKDSIYADKPMHDKSGRFTPYWNRAENNVISYESVPIPTDCTAEYYAVPKKTLRETITEPFFYPIQGKPVLMTSVAVPIIDKHTGAFLGVAGIDIFPFKYQKLADAAKPYGTGYGILISNKGQYIVRSKIEKIGGTLTAYGDLSFRNQMVNSIVYGKELSGIEHNKESDKKFFLQLVPIHIGNTDTPWSFLIVVPEEKILEVPNMIMHRSFVIGVIFAFLIILIGILIFRLDGKRQSVEDELFKEKEQLQVTLKSIGDGVITTDISGRITMMNRIAEKLTGWKVEEAKGRLLTEVFCIMNKISQKPYGSPIEKVIRTGTIQELENNTVLTTKDGRKLTVSDSGAPIFDKRSNIIGAVLVFRDITEKEKIDEELRNSQRIESIGVLAGGIAHDFNNLLCGLFAYIEMALKFSSGNDRATKCLENAMSVFDRAKSLTQQLLVFSKSGGLSKKTVILSDTIVETVNFSLSGTNIECKFNIAQDLMPCDVDTSQICQAIENIVINAKQAMPGGGTLYVSAMNVPAEQVPFKSKNDDSSEYYAAIRIRDEGEGIPKDVLPRIFDPFFTTRKGSSGIGLATTYSIVKKHSGFINVESELGKGSIFSIYLPVSRKAVASENISENSRAISNARILLMDDEDFLRNVTSEMLKHMGCEVITTSKGEEAIEVFRKENDAGRHFDVIIFDLTIRGGMGGCETVKKILEIAPSAKVIASSGYSEDPVMEDPVKFGFRDMLVKPYGEVELMDVIRRVMRQR